MEVMPTLFLTGRPAVGKTTVIKGIVEALGEGADGFYTEEIQEAGKRQGFRLIGLRGEQVIMAHTRLKGQRRPHVGRYGVDVTAVEQVGVAAVERAISQKRVVIIDEVGKMELFSQAFKKVVLAAMDGQAPVIATVMARPQPWVDTLKARPDLTLWEVTVENRARMASRVMEWVRSIRRDQGWFLSTKGK
jgi:nucleoside-triphosphatase